MGILEKIAEIENEVFLCFISPQLFMMVLFHGIFWSITDGANAEEQGNSPPSWIVESSISEITEGTHHTKRRRGSDRRGLVLRLNFKQLLRCLFLSCSKFLDNYVITPVPLNIK